MMFRTGIRLEVSTSGSLGGITGMALVLALVQVCFPWKGARAVFSVITLNLRCFQGFVLLSIGNVREVQCFNALIYFFVKLSL